MRRSIFIFIPFIILCTAFAACSRASTADDDYHPGIGVPLLSITSTHADAITNLYVGESTFVTLAVTNVGSSRATNLSATTLPVGFTYLYGEYPGWGGTCSETLNVGATCTLSLTFTSLSRDLTSSDFGITYHNGPDSRERSASYSITSAGLWGTVGSLDTQTFGSTGYYLSQAHYQDICGGTPQYNHMTINRDGNPIIIGVGCSFLSIQGPFGTVFEDTTPGNYPKVLAQSTGEIVVAGDIGNPNYLSIVRLNSDGDHDYSFGTGGYVSTNIGTTISSWALAEAPGGKIVAAGGDSRDALGNYSGAGKFAVVRYQSDGSLDTNFNGTGKVTTTLADNAAVYAMSVDSNGKTLVGGISVMDTGSSRSLVIVRYLSNGSLDTSFSGDGILYTSINLQAAMAMAVQSDGKIVVAGPHFNGTYVEIEVVRYLSDGSLDTTFGTNGVTTASPGAYDVTGWAVAVLSNGKILVTGTTSSGYALAKFTATGQLDTTFASSGWSFQSGITATIETSVLQPDGKLLLGGWEYIPNPDGQGSHFMARIWL